MTHEAFFTFFVLMKDNVIIVIFLMLLIHQETPGRKKDFEITFQGILECQNVMYYLLLVAIKKLLMGMMLEIQYLNLVFISASRSFNILRAHY